MHQVLGEKGLDSMTQRHGPSSSEFFYPETTRLQPSSLFNCLGYKMSESRRLGYGVFTPYDSPPFCQTRRCFNYRRGRSTDISQKNERRNLQIQHAV